MSESHDHIRIAGRTDAPAVARLVAGFRDHLRAVTPLDDVLAAALPGLLEHSGSEFALGFAGPEPVGYTLTRFFPSLWGEGFEAFLEDLFVEASARGQGWGQRLVAHALEGAQMRGCTLIALNTNENNHSALGLYEAMGFRLQSEAVWDGGREVKLTRRLSPRSDSGSSTSVDRG